MRRIRTTEQPQAVATYDDAYAATRERVDVAHRRMRRISEAPHTPAQARAAAGELTLALRAATCTATRALQAAVAAAPPARRRGRRGRAGRAASPASRPWAAELVRLSSLAVWLRRTTMDDLGVCVPTTVRASNRAATGPAVAGLIAEPEDVVTVPPSEPGIGVDLPAIVDGGESAAGAAAATSPVVEGHALDRVA